MLHLTVLQNCGTIQLPKGMNTLVDADHRRLLNALTWGLIHQGGAYYYAIHQERRQRKLWSIKLQVFVLDPPNGMWVDHKNRDTLDNRRSNLRICTRSQNCQNSGKTKRRTGSTSRFKGVNQRKTGMWEARITKDRITTHLGSFATEQEAADAYDKAAREIHGEFAVTNEDLQPNA